MKIAFFNCQKKKSEKGILWKSWHASLTFAIRNFRELFFSAGTALLFPTTIQKPIFLTSGKTIYSWYLSHRMTKPTKWLVHPADAQADLSLNWAHSSFCLFCHAAAHLPFLCSCSSFEPPHEKTNKVTVCPAKTQIILGIRPVYSESSPCA